MSNEDGPQPDPCALRLWPALFRMPTRTDPDRPGELVQPLEPCAVIQFLDRELVRIVLNDRQVRTVHQRFVALVGDPSPSLELALGLACDALDDEGYAPRRVRLVTDYNAEFARLMAKRSGTERSVLPSREAVPA